MELKRTKDLIEYINNKNLEYCDDLDYKYLFIDSHIDIHNTITEYGWGRDYLGVYVKNEKVGYITYDIHNYRLNIDNINIFIDKPYLNQGYGSLALINFIYYILVKRNFNKVNYGVLVENKKMLTLARKLIKYAGREVGVSKRQVKLRDNNYYDLVNFEILKEELTNEVCEKIYENYRVN